MKRGRPIKKEGRKKKIAITIDLWIYEKLVNEKINKSEEINRILKEHYGNLRN